MSPGLLELIRSCWDAVARGDHEALLAACDEAVVWDLSRLGAGGEPLRHGREGARSVLEELEWRAPGTCIASGERLLVDAHDDATAAVVHEVRGGRIVRLSSISGLWESQLALTGTAPVAVVRAVWSLWEARDMDRVMACFADDVVFDLSHYVGWRGASRYDGPTSMIGFLAEWMGWWHGYRQEVLGYERHGGDVLVSVRHGGERDGERVDEIGGLVYSVRPDGIMDRWTVFNTPERARRWLALGKAPAEAQ